jgi:hypothetical protein
VHIRGYTFNLKEVSAINEFDVDSFAPNNSKNQLEVEIGIKVRFLPSIITKKNPTQRGRG